MAVVPFELIPRDESRSYVSYGITTEVIGKLANNVALRLAPKSVSFTIGTGESPLQFAQRLGVRYVLDGTVRDLGQTLSVTVELLSAADGMSIWGDTLEASETQLFQLIDGLTRGIERNLGVATQPQTVAHIPHPEAFRKRLSAAFLANQGDEKSLTQAIAEITSALEIDPNYPLAWSNLAILTATSANVGWTSRAEAYRVIKTAASNLLRLVPESAMAYRLSSKIFLAYEGDVSAAAKSMQRALDAEPYNLPLLTDAAILLLQIGRIEDAIQLEEYLVRRSPFDAIASHNLALAYLYADRLEDSLRQQKRTQELEPNRAHLQYWFGETYLLNDQLELAERAFSAETDAAYKLKGQALIALARNQSAKALALIEEYIQQFGDKWPSEVAHMYAYAGDQAAAFQWLAKELEAYGPGGWGEWQLQRLYDKLRDTPQWREFLLSTGTHPAQVNDIELKIDLTSY